MFKPIKSLLSPTIKSSNSWKTQLLAQWPDIVGNLHSKMNLEKVYNDTLVIGVYDAGWLQELYMLSNVIIKIVNDHLKETRIKKIRFKHTVYTPVKQKTKTKKSESIPRKKIPLNSQEKKTLSRIKDVETRNALHLFLSRCKEK